MVRIIFKPTHRITPTRIKIDCFRRLNKACVNTSVEKATNLMRFLI